MMAVNVSTQLAIASARIAYFWPEILRLEQYLWSNFGLYIQGLRTHTIIPVDGVLTAPDFPNLTVQDQAIGWGRFLMAFPPTMMTALSIITYKAPDAHSGFIARFEMRLNGDVYKKQMAYGPYSDRETYDWIIVEEDD